MFAFQHDGKSCILVIQNVNSLNYIYIVLSCHSRLDEMGDFHARGLI